MRRNRIVVPAVCSVVVLARCGGGSGTKGSAAGHSSAPSTSAAPSLPAEAVQFSQAFSEHANDPAELVSVLQQAEAQVRAIHPPAEIADDWKKLADSLKEFAGVYAGLHTNNPAAASSFAQRNAQLLAALGTAGTHIQAFVANTCDLSVAPSSPPTGSAAPTS